MGATPLTSGAPRRRRLFRVIAPAYPAFNIYSAVASQTTSLGPVSIATIARELPGWDAEVIDENNYGRYGPKDVHGRPDHAALQLARPADVVGIYGGLTSTIPRLFEIVEAYKKLGVRPIVGGQHFLGDNIAHALQAGVSAVVVGEGDVTIQELLPVLADDGDRSQVAGIAYLEDGEVRQTPARPPITDFDGLPLPDFSLVRNASLSLFPVSWARGCGMNCEFCTVKGRARFSRPERVLEQFARLVETHRARRFFIVDDLFGQNRTETLRLCRLLSDYQKQTRVRLTLTVQIRLDKAYDTELLQAMREAGVTMVAIGIESPIEEELLAMNKRLKPDEMIEQARRYHKAGFLVHGMFIFGYPLPEGTTFDMPLKERVKQFRRFIRKAKIDTVQVLLPVPLPGTEMTARLQEDHRLYPRECVGWEYYDGNFPLYTPDPPLTPEEMQEGVKRIMGRFYRFRHVLAVGLHVITFPRMAFWLHDLKTGWQRWHRVWRNSLTRFGGWLVIRKWNREFNKGIFTGKLEQAKHRDERRG